MLVAGPGPEEAGEPLVVQHQVPPEAQPPHHLLVLDQPLEARAHWGKIFIHEKLCKLVFLVEIYILRL